MKMFIIINGSLLNHFKWSERLRQRDSLSPFLFVLVMKVLNKLMNKPLECELT